MILPVSCYGNSPSFYYTTTNYRSSRPEVFCKKVVLRNFAKFTEKHLCQSLFFLLKKRLWHRCFPLNFAKFYRTSPVAASVINLSLLLFILFAFNWKEQQFSIAFLRLLLCQRIRSKKIFYRQSNNLYNFVAIKGIFLVYSFSEQVAAKGNIQETT